MKTLRLLFSIILITSMVYACSSDDGDEITPENPIENKELKAAEDYFNNTLKTVVNTNCTSCHTNYHSSGSSNYSVFSNARSSATNMYNLVNAGSMPKGGDKLSDADINKFKAFKDLVDAIP